MGMSLKIVFLYSSNSLFIGNYAIPLITLCHNNKCLRQLTEMQKLWESPVCGGCSFDAVHDGRSVWQNETVISLFGTKVKGVGFNPTVLCKGSCW